MNTKVCTKCSKNLVLTDFCKGNNKDGLYCRCKQCMKKSHRQYYIKNKDKIDKQHRDYYKNNKEISKLRSIKNAKNRRKVDIDFKLRNYLRTRIWNALKMNIKSNSTTKLLGCSIEFLKYYLTKQFKPGMSWSNYGKWHIDHIRPCCTFDLSKPEEQRKCFHYTNLQPLWAFDNLSKSKKEII